MCRKRRNIKKTIKSNKKKIETPVLSLLNRENSYKILNGSCYGVAGTNLILDIGCNFYRHRDFYNQIKKNLMNCRPNWKVFPREIDLFISHMHEDHYSGIYFIPPEIKINLYIGQVSFNILKSKTKEFGLSLPNFETVTFLSDGMSIFKKNYSILSVKIPHNIVDNWGFEIICERERKRIIYVPDISEEFWKFFSVKQGDTIVLDILPELSRKMKKNDLLFISLESQKKFNKGIFVDYGWDIDRINFFLRNYFEHLPVYISPTINDNFKTIGYHCSRIYQVATVENLDLLDRYIYICDMEEFISVNEMYFNEKVALISNLYELSMFYENIFKKSEYEFFNFFKSGHFSACKINKYLENMLKECNFHLINNQG